MVARFESKTRFTNTKEIERAREGKKGKERKRTEVMGSIQTKR
jgi:hypothetical protein